MGIKITGDCMVFAKDFDGRKAYSIGISKKKENGEYEKYSASWRNIGKVAQVRFV